MSNDLRPVTDRVALVYNQSKDTMRIRPKKGYEVSLMIGETIEAFIVAEDGSETVVLKMEPSPRGVKVVRHKDGAVDVIYKEAE